MTGSGVTATRPRHRLDSDDEGGEAMVTAMAALELATVMGEAGLEELERLRGKEFMMDPRFVASLVSLCYPTDTLCYHTSIFNARRVRHSCLPGSGIVASARGLANIAAWLGDHDIVGGGTADAQSYGLGFRRFSFQDQDGRVGRGIAPMVACAC